MSGFGITFVLPSRGGGGGANSVIQEALGLSRLGVECRIAVNQENFSAFKQAYPELALSQVKSSAYSTPEQLAEILTLSDIVCATTALSVSTTLQSLDAIPDKKKRPRTAYYVQDYEPLFFDPSTPEWESARSSYTALPNAALFAKTHWICSMVHENHNVLVNKVQPSLDHEIFYPDLKRNTDGVVRVSAMLRPRTKRRAPVRTVRILSWLAETYGNTASIQVFGATAEELAHFGLDLPASIVNYGPLRRAAMPTVLRRSDLFLDLSDYQAFGRTALEAMASGCVPVLPLFGGTGEFARHGWNGFLVDTRSDAAIQEAVSAFMRSSPADRAALRMNGLVTAADYSIHKAAMSELELFQKLLSA